MIVKRTSSSNDSNNNNNIGVHLRFQTKMEHLLSLV